MRIISLARGVVWLIAGILAAMVSYLLLLTGAAWFAPRRTAARGRAPDTRFLFMIPAHNEERLLPTLLTNLHQLDYPSTLYAIHVVADNCTDRTAELARQAGAIVHERTNTERLGKGYALEWLLERIWERGDAHDAMVILDADTIVSPNFLTVMDARLARGERVIQAYYAVRDPEASWSASLRSIALMAVHYVRPQGRMVLGGSAGLKGNGMVFRADIMRRYRWPASLTEDIEYHMALIQGGERVMFAPDAVVWAEMPGTLRAAQSQNARWERGRLQMVRQYVPRLLRTALTRRNFLLFDAAVEQLIPPFSIVTIGSLVCLLAAAALQSVRATILCAGTILGQIIYIVASLILARAPRKLYQALLYAPAFIAWKIWLYVRVLIGRDQHGWVRTARNDS